MELYLDNKVAKTEEDIVRVIKLIEKTVKINKLTKDYLEKFAEVLKPYNDIDIEFDVKRLVVLSALDELKWTDLKIDRTGEENLLYYFDCINLYSIEICTKLKERVKSLDSIGYTLYSILKSSFGKSILPFKDDELEEMLLRKTNIHVLVDDIKNLPLSEEKRQEILSEREKTCEDLYEMFANLNGFGCYAYEKDIMNLFSLVGIKFNKNDWRELYYWECPDEYNTIDGYYKHDLRKFVCCLGKSYSDPKVAEIVDRLVTKYFLEEDQHLLVDGEGPKDTPKVRAKKDQH